MSSCDDIEWSRRRRRRSVPCGRPTGGTMSVSCGTEYSYCTDRYYLRRMKELLQDAVKPRPQPPADPVQLTEHVFLGNQRNADNCDLLRTIGITHVLSCASTRRNTSEDIPYSLAETGVRGFLLIPAEDREDFNIQRFFQTTIRFLDNVKHEGGKVLVHCTMGVNRSAAVVAAYLMVHLGWNLLPVVTYLKTKRLHVLSNKGFRQQLVSFARHQGYLDPVLRPVDDGGGYGVSCRDHVGDILVDVGDVTRRRSASAGRRQRVVVNNNIENGLEQRTQFCNIDSRSEEKECNGCLMSSKRSVNIERMNELRQDGPATHEVHRSQGGASDSRRPVGSLSNGTCQPPSQTQSTVNNGDVTTGPPTHTTVNTGPHRHCSSYTHYININYQLPHRPHDVTVASQPRPWTNTVNNSNHGDGANGSSSSGNTEGFLILVERRTRPLK